ncbi:(Fe-S)-binding protein [Gordonia rhizosphera NBRC 16068]|uniref:(Fe-S)-binding protein n=1 Tax=Gordonia rhizosphera TaxID=83341 RepID=UPI003EDFDB45
MADQSVTRPIFEGVGTPGEIIFYVLATASIATFGYGVWRRVSKYRRGRPAGRGKTIREALFGHPFAGVRERGDRGSAGVVASNASVARGSPMVGLAHFGVFWGFIVLFMGTVILTIDYDVVRLAGKAFTGHDIRFFHGWFYLIYSVVLDTVALAAVLGLGYLIVRRWLLKPSRLDYTRAAEPDGGSDRSQFVRGDWLFAGGLGLILLTGLLEEGARIRAADFPSFEVWSPVGWVIGRFYEVIGISASASYTLHTVLWWVHALLALAFVAYLPYSKAMHMLADGVDVLAHDRTATLALPESAPDTGHAGYTTIEDFTWKELLDLDACTKCGRCHEVCPARTAGAPLSPRDLILDLRQWVDESSGGIAVLDREKRSVEPGADAAIAGDVIKSRTLWSCTTCMACVQTCPVGIEHVPTIVQLRRTLVEDGDMDNSLQQALQNLAGQGNSFGKSARMRSKWTKKLDTKITDARKEPVKYLWFVGDYAAYDDRLADNSRLLARLLTEAGVDFGILYEAEWNSGNDVRRVGEEGLFEQLAEHNIEALQQAQFEEIFTTDPHSLNALRNEYPKLGAKYTVWHYTELLAHLVETGTLPVQQLGLRVTYHDPCYLARYNGVTEAPRRILSALGCELVEMPRNRTNTFCCGAGGGRIWMDDSFLSERPSENRIKEAATLDVSHFVVSCPKDMTMYSDAVKTTGHADSLTVLDITQLVAMAAIPPENEPLEAGVSG